MFNQIGMLAGSMREHSQFAIDETAILVDIVVVQATEIIQAQLNKLIEHWMPRIDVQHRYLHMRSRFATMNSVNSVLCILT